MIVSKHLFASALTASALLWSSGLAAAQQSGTAAEAKAMLEHAVTALKAGEATALTEFNDKTNKQFHDRDLYVFCVNMSDGKMTAHPNPALMGTDARALKLNSRLAPQRYEEVAVLFCDVVGFTAYSERHPPETVFAELEALVDRFEEIAHGHGLEKIKTVGDAFMATANLLSPLDEPVQAAVACALDMVAAAQTVRADWAVRIGIDFGPVSAGIMGKRQFQFDVWGDTVNTAARIEEYGRPGSVNVSGRAWLQLRNRAQGRSLGFVDLKGKEKIEVVECVALRE